MSHIINTDNFSHSKTNGTHDTHDNSQDTYNKRVEKCDSKFDTSLNFNSKFEPICVRKTRETLNPEPSKKVLSWMKEKGLTGTQRLQIAKTFFASEDVFDLLDVPKFSCDFVQEIRFFDENCMVGLPPVADRIIMDSVIVFHSTSELDTQIAGKRKIIPLRKIFRQDKNGQIVNTKIFDKIFMKCYYTLLNPPSDEELAFKIYREWLESVELFVEDIIDPNTALEESIIRILTTKRFNKSQSSIFQDVIKENGSKNGLFREVDGK